MTEYHPEVIQKFADRLYRQAKVVVIVNTLVGILFGGGLGIFLQKLLSSLPNFGKNGFLGSPLTSLMAAAVGAVLLGLIALWAGMQRAFLLRLQAQTALCQMRIEENTRRQTPASL